MLNRFLKCAPSALCLVGILASGSSAEEYLNGIKWEPPAIVDPGETDDQPPADAVILFDGSGLDDWKNGENWEVRDDVAYSGKGQIVSKQEFGDCQVHVEWSAPVPAKGSGQGRGNSGIFLMGRYELQVLDSYDNETYYDGQAGAIYKQMPPAVNVTRKPGEWNTYDIFWTAPRFGDDGSFQSPAYITVVHNGVLIHNHLELKGDTPFNRPPRYDAHGPKGPIAIQDHGNPVGFRNIWVREYEPAHGTQEREPYIKDGDKEIPIRG